MCVLRVYNIVTEENCDRIVRSGLVQYVLDVFDVKLKSASSKVNPKILSSALDTLVHVSNTSKSFWRFPRDENVIACSRAFDLFYSFICCLDNGRVALRKSNKLNALYKFSVRCPDEQMYNSAMSKLYTVIIMCREKSHLPLSSTRSAYVFGLDDTKADDDGKVRWR